MKVIYKSQAYKVMSVLRSLMVKVYYLNKLSLPKISMIGRRCGVYIKGAGSIRCRGRIIVNDDVMLYSKGELILGENFGINSYSRIVAHEKIEIGNNVTIGQMVSILDHDHKYLIQGDTMGLDGYRTAPVRVGDNVWIGDKSTILKGVTVGKNVVIGANTLVNRDVPDNCVVGGIPFKILKRLS